MEKKDGACEDASMLMVFIPTADATEAGMEAEEAKAATLIAGTCDNTPPGAITIAAEGSCFNFVPTQSAAQSTWTMDLTGVTAGLVIAAQHVPIEFEETIHYFYDSSNTDTPADAFMIEPVAEEGGGGGAHSHGEAEICACAATEPDHPYSLDCNDADAIEASAAFLRTCDNTTVGCAATETVDGEVMMLCRGAYFHIHYIHGWCGDESMTLEQEQTLHDYEEFCPMCLVERPFVEGHPTCVQPDCDDVAAALVHAAVLTDNGCEIEGADGTCCRTDAEIAAWRAVL